MFHVKHRVLLELKSVSRGIHRTILNRVGKWGKQRRDPHRPHARNSPHMLRKTLSAILLDGKRLTVNTYAVINRGPALKTCVIKATIQAELWFSFCEIPSPALNGVIGSLLLISIGRRRLFNLDRGDSHYNEP